MILIVDCCIRGEASITRRYYQAYLETVPNEDICILELAGLRIAPLDNDALQRRDDLCQEKRFDHEMFCLARQFRDADEIWIAAPFWDLSFPALLKVYLEQIMVSGLTFGYAQDGRCVGYCRAKRLRYFSTCGGYYGAQHLGYEYVKALAAMLGIETCIPYILEGLDIDPQRREQILQQAIGNLQQPGCVQE